MIDKKRSIKHDVHLDNNCTVCALTMSSLGRTHCNCIVRYEHFAGRFCLKQIKSPVTHHLHTHTS